LGDGLVAGDLSHCSAQKVLALGAFAPRRLNGQDEIGKGAIKPSGRHVCIGVQGGLEPFPVPRVTVKRPALYGVIQRQFVQCCRGSHLFNITFLGSTLFGLDAGLLQKRGPLDHFRFDKGLGLR